MYEDDVVRERFLFHSTALTVGMYACRISSHHFVEPAPAESYYVIFPRTSIEIRPDGTVPIIADPNTVIFHNKDQVYTQRALADRVYRCDWFAFNAQIIADAIGSYDPAAAARADRPFALGHGPSRPRSYLTQRLIIQQLLDVGPIDAMQMEEMIMRLLDAVIADAYQARGMETQRRSATARHTAIERVEAVKALIAERFRESLSLHEIAQAVDTSPYHLCHVFRQQTGSPIHRYLSQIRLRTSLDYLTQRNVDLATLGAELGFASHSHFTQAFKNTFGILPSELRRSLSARSARESASFL